MIWCVCNHHITGNNCRHQFIAATKHKAACPNDKQFVLFVWIFTAQRGVLTTSIYTWLRSPWHSWVVFSYSIYTRVGFVNTNTSGGRSFPNNTTPLDGGHAIGHSITFELNCLRRSETSRNREARFADRQPDAFRSVCAASYILMWAHKSMSI